MKGKTKFLIFLIIALLLSSFAVNVFAESGGAMGWYCTRNRDHRQPIADAPLRYVEEYGGYYIDKKHGDENEEKVVYLTFDAGYENGNVERILDVMKEENVKGAFFVLGNLISKNTELVRRMAQEGHTVCNHTNRHRDMTKVGSIEEFRAELEALETLYRENVGGEMAKYYRPPEGKFNETSMKYACELGYKTVFWSFAYADWDNARQMSPEAAKKKIMDNIHNGAVILLHPTSATNAEILGDVIRELKSQGYSFGTLDELTA
ncbi:MAG: polysaccharide deacetylase family protein [Clostridia bacterium]|nr:polysaccharide deacetylase family protein [Clostridia bacterium]